MATSEVPVGGGVILDDADYVITQPTEGTYKAFSKICTHQNCPVASVERRHHQLLLPRQQVLHRGRVRGEPARPQPAAGGEGTVAGGKVVVTE